MPPSLPNSPNAQTVQGPGPSGQEGYPIATVPATGASPTDVNIVSGGGGAVTISNGADVAEGNTSDAAVTGDTAGTVSAKLRGINKILAAVSNFATGFIRNSAVNTLNQAQEILGDGQPHALLGQNLPLNASIAYFFETATNRWSPARNYAQGQNLPTGLIATGISIAGYLVRGNTSSAYSLWTPCDLSNPNIGITPVGGADEGAVGAVPFLVTGKTGNAPIDVRQYEAQRTPSIFRTVSTAAAGNTAIWAPAAGKKFRIMRYIIVVTDDATQAAPGRVVITLFDGAAGVTSQVHETFVPAVGLLNTGALYNSGWIDLGNGILSALANNVLNVNLSAALTAGVVRIICCGTEET